VATSRLVFAVRGLAVLAALSVSGALLAQAVPPPGVEAARPPTERTLQPVDRSQTRERVRSSRDCRKAEAEIRGQYRIQADSVRTQYDARIDAASGPAREALVKEREAKLQTLHSEADGAAKQIVDKCREDNAALLRSPNMSHDPR
jgi:hypothetical protein